jgi:glucosamine-6-phosphate deaminase
MTTLKEFSVGALTIHMAKSRIAMDRRAAAEIARKIRACLEKQSDVRMVFAAALSQSECATVLREDEEINWPQINAFHMDEHLVSPQTRRNASASGCIMRSSKMSFIQA